MQSVSSRIWTRVAVSISYDDNLTYVLVPASLAVFCISGSSNFDSFRDGR